MTSVDPSPTGTARGSTEHEKIATSGTVSPDLEKSTSKEGEDAPQAPVVELSAIRKYAILLILCFAQFFDIYNSVAAIIAAPTLAADLGFRPNDIQWVVSAYSLTFAAFMLISGRLSDIFHPKPVFVLGFLVVGLLSIPIALSVNPIMLIVFRALQGIGAAMNIPPAVSMIASIFPDEREKSRAYALYGIFGSTGNALGFILGGVLTAKASWRWVFWLLAILIIPGAIASWFLLPSQGPRDPAQAKRSLDFPGVIAVTCGLILFVFAISSGQGSVSEGAQWGKAIFIAPLIISIALFVGFFFIERISKDPALPPRTWSNKNFTPLFIYGWSVYWWVYGAQLSLVEVFMNLWGWSALSAATHCIPIGITCITVSYLIGLVGHKIPRKALLLAGQVLMAGGTVLFALADTPNKYWSYILPGMIIGMAGLMIAYVGSTIAMMEGARKGDEGVVGAMTYTSYLIGSTIGLAIVSSITLSVNAQSGAAHGLHYGYAAGFWSLVGLNGVMGIIAIVFIKS